jgi:hypothetical protein
VVSRVDLRLHGRVPGIPTALNYNSLKLNNIDGIYYSSARLFNADFL